VQGAPALALNQWHCLTATYDGAFLRYYIDGKLTGSTPKSGGIIPPTLQPIWIGANNLSAQPFKGPGVWTFQRLMYRHN
jgi:hypothetical protein